MGRRQSQDRRRLGPNWRRPKGQPEGVGVNREEGDPPHSERAGNLTPPSLPHSENENYLKGKNQEDCHFLGSWKKQFFLPGFVYARSLFLEYTEHYTVMVPNFCYGPEIANIAPHPPSLSAIHLITRPSLSSPLDDRR